MASSALPDSAVSRVAETTVILPSRHPQQAEVGRSGARFRVLACGRRWGKTLLGAALCLEVGLQGGRAWWVGPDYPRSAHGWGEIRRQSKQIAGSRIRESERLIELPGGGWVQAKSADNPDSLRGVGLDFVVMDEAAYCEERAWTEGIRPALSDRGGRALLISTPAGRDWFWRMWQRGQDPEYPDWQSWRFPTVGNPYIASDEVESARRDSTERTFLQEYLAEFLDDGGAVFREVRKRVVDEVVRYEPDHRYVIGVDWGRSHDFSVFVVVDATARRVVQVDRSTGVEYAIQRGRLLALAQRWHPVRILAEMNAMGDPIVEQLVRDGLPVEGFVTTNRSKAELVDGLALALEQGTLELLDDPVLVAELEAFAGNRLASGLVRYGAPGGMHDDTVMALALAWKAALALVNRAVWQVNRMKVSYIR